MKKIVISLTVVIVISVGFLSGCMQDEKKSSKNNEVDSLSLGGDEQFISWFLEFSQNFSSNFYYYQDAIDNMDAVKIKYWAEMREELAQNALSEIDNFKLSQGYEVIREEYLLSLEDLEKSGFYHAKCAATMIEEGMSDDAKYYGDMGTSYLEKSTIHMDNVYNIIKEVVE